MRGGEDGGVVGGAADAGRPGEGLETGAVEIGDAAETAPARHRDESLEPGIVRHAREPLDVVPCGTKHPVDRSDRARVVHVQAEQPELEAIGALHGVGVTLESSAFRPAIDAVDWTRL